MNSFIENYIERLKYALDQNVMNLISELGQALKNAWYQRKVVYLCGNGGSAGNAIHLANDLIYGAGMRVGLGLRVEALSANPAVITCLSNDLGYDEVYAQQLRVKGESKDVLIVLSGSGNSPNVVKALEVGNQLGMITCGILGFSGGKCKELAQIPIHFPVNDMQIAEDLQLIVGHICMQWLCEVLIKDGELQSSSSNERFIA